MERKIPKKREDTLKMSNPSHHERVDSVGEPKGGKSITSTKPSKCRSKKSLEEAKKKEDKSAVANPSTTQSAKCKEKKFLKREGLRNVSGSSSFLCTESMKKTAPKKEEGPFDATNTVIPKCTRNLVKNIRRRNEDLSKTSNSSRSESTEETVSLRGENVSVKETVNLSVKEKCVEETVRESDEEEFAKIMRSREKESAEIMSGSSEEESAQIMRGNSDEESVEDYQSSEEVVSSSSSASPDTKEFGLLCQFKSSIKVITARVVSNKMPQKNLIEALNIIHDSFSYLCIKRSRVNTEFNNLYELYVNLKNALNISNADNSAGVLPSNAADKEYNPSTRMSLRQTETITPLSSVRAIRDDIKHYKLREDWIEKLRNSLKNYNTIEENYVLQLINAMLSIGKSVMKDFIDFVEFVNGKDRILLEEAESPTNLLSRKEDSFIQAQIERKKELDNFKSLIFELNNQLPKAKRSDETKQQARDKSLCDRLEALRTMYPSPAELPEHPIPPINDLVKELCRLSYMVEGLVRSCMDMENSILLFSCKVGTECNPRAMKTFLNRTLQVFDQLVCLRQSYGEFLNKFEDKNNIAEEYILIYKINFAMKFERLLTIVFKVNINFWTYYKYIPPLLTL